MFEVITGAVLAGVLVALLRHARFERVLRFWAVALSVAAAIYVGFVLVGSAQAQWFWVEVAGFILFSGLAFLGFKFSPWVLALAWLAHNRVGYIAALTEHSFCSTMVSGGVHGLRSCSGRLSHCRVQSVA